MTIISQEQANELIYYAIQSQRAKKSGNHDDAIKFSNHAKIHFSGIRSRHYFFPDENTSIYAGQLFDLPIPNVDSVVEFLRQGKNAKIRLQNNIDSEQGLIALCLSEFNLANKDAAADPVAYTFSEEDRPHFSRYFLDVYGKRALLGLAIALACAAIGFLIPATATLMFIISVPILSSALSMPMVDWLFIPKHVPALPENDLNEALPLFQN